MTATKRVRTGRPKFIGVTTYDDPFGRFEFRHPVDWIRHEPDGDREGVVVIPRDADPETYFAVQVVDLGTPVTSADLEVLRSGVDDGIAALPEVEIESSSDDLYNDIVKLERVFAFTEDGERRKRRVWALYADHWQFLVAYQGATVEEFDYWYPMGNYCYTAFQLPHALWFATDPGVRD